jgi:hypothetical protein
MFLGVPFAVLAAEVVRSECAGGTGRVSTLLLQSIPTMQQPVFHPGRDEDPPLEASTAIAAFLFGASASSGPLFGTSGC